MPFETIITMSLSVFLFKLAWSYWCIGVMFRIPAVPLGRMIYLDLRVIIKVVECRVVL